MALYVVTGSPGCGKSTWVRNTAKPGDIRFGGDELTNAITGKTEAKHHHDNLTSKISRAAREAGIREAVKHRNQIDIYLLISNLSRDEELKYRRLGAKFIVIDPGYDIALQRCRDHRPGYKHRLVDAWYNRRDQWPKDARIINPDIIGQDDGGEAAVPKPKPTPKSTTERGYGWEHQKKRDRLLRRHKDGTECDWCARPMYRDKRKNFDGQALEADHPDADKSRTATKLLHKRCNVQKSNKKGVDHGPEWYAKYAPEHRPTPPVTPGTQTVW